MKRAFLLSLFFFMAVCLVSEGSALATGPEDAKALGQKAAAFVKANGKEKGAAEINNPKGQFVKGDLYVTLHNLKGTFLANPVNPGMVGKDCWDLKDPNTGKYFVREAAEIAKKGGGWQEYNWVNPKTKKVQAKKSWIQPIEGTEMYTLSGVFQ